MNRILNLITLVYGTISTVSLFSTNVHACMPNLTQAYHHRPNLLDFKQVFHVLTNTTMNVSACR